MWTYDQKTGLIERTWNQQRRRLGPGYSGHAEGLNNPDMQADKDTGPIPRGRCTIGGFHSEPVFGPVVARLYPAEDNEMFGRSGFLIHGDNAAEDFTGSHGCIVLPREVREAIADSMDTWLEVV